MKRDQVQQVQSPHTWYAISFSACSLSSSLHSLKYLQRKRNAHEHCISSPKETTLSGTRNWESTWRCKEPTWQIRGGQHCPCRSRSTGRGRHKRRCTPHCRWSRYYKMDQYCMHIRESAPSAALEILHLTRIHHIRETEEVQMKTHRTLQWTISLCSHMQQGTQEWSNGKKPAYHPIQSVLDVKDGQQGRFYGKALSWTGIW